ncbi:MAG: glycerol-3-phosphate acyltransferase, partial [Firmicutes bacterium]|nr:glycerol-3-phosphate acyltransferase [Candidatus Caballimonas caccae]
MTVNYILLGVFALCSYFFGNLNWAIIISKNKKSDIRNLGSGNPGTLNMGRNFGLKVGLLVFFLDVLKGVI